MPSRCVHHHTTGGQPCEHKPLGPPPYRTHNTQVAHVPPRETCTAPLPPGAWWERGGGCGLRGRGGRRRERAGLLRQGVRLHGSPHKLPKRYRAICTALYPSRRGNGAAAGTGGRSIDRDVMRVLQPSFVFRRSPRRRRLQRPQHHHRGDTQKNLIYTTHPVGRSCAPHCGRALAALNAQT